MDEGSPRSIADICDKLVGAMPRNLNGIECYSEMRNAGYSKAGWAEWAGGYAEYRMDQAIRDLGLSEDVAFHQDRSSGGIDLDLKFPKLNSFGDIKTHSVASSGILGNDYETIEKFLEGSPDGHIYYLVFNFRFTKDSECGNEVTHFWNDMLGKSNRNSYGRRMKHDGTLESAVLLDISKETWENVESFNQGRNSNGKPRRKKIMIRKSGIDAFKIREWDFTQA